MLEDFADVILAHCTLLALHRFMHGFVILIDSEKNWLDLPSHIYEEVKGKTLVEHLLEQVGSFLFPVVLSIFKGDPKRLFWEEVGNKSTGISLLFTNEKNETRRVKEAADHLNLDHIIRLSGDNPILGHSIIPRGLKALESNDYAFSYGYPVGIQLEFLNRKVLDLCEGIQSPKRIREIVRNDLVKQLQIAPLQPQTAELSRPELRWTTGTSQDCQLVSKMLETANREDLSSLRAMMKVHEKIQTDYLPMPTMVNIEPTNKCNLKCVMCPRDEMERSLGTMSMDTFRKVADECAEMGVNLITLNGYGEPFISDNIFEMIDYAMRIGLQVKINTNGHYLNEKNVNRLLMSPPTHLSISLDGATKETYEKVRIRGNFERVMKNLETLLELRRLNPHSTMKVSLQIIRMDETEEEIEQFKSEWKDRVDEISIPNVHNWGGVFKESGALGEQNLNRFPCRELWRTMMVFCDGSTSICCAVFDDNMNMGNIAQKSLKEIWKGSDYQKLRELHLSGRYDEIDICKDCNMWKVQG